MNRRAAKSLHDAVEASDELLSRFGDTSFERYLADRDLQLITERIIIAIGECIAQAVRAEPSLLDTSPEALDVIGTRNRVAHGYDDIRAEVIWDIAVNNIPNLRRNQAELLFA